MALIALIFCFPVILIIAGAIVLILIVLYVVGAGGFDGALRDITEMYRFNKVYSKLDSIDRNLDTVTKTVKKRKTTGRKITRTVAHKDKGVIAQEIIEE